MTIPQDSVKSEYHGFARYDFQVLGFDAVMIDCGIKSDRWIWRAEFLGAFDSVDVDMLRHGYHLFHFCISNLYGCPKSIDLMKQFHEFMTGTLGMRQKGIIFGFSRGGLYAVNFAHAHPEAISALYLDAPVLDIKSWPCGLGSGSGSSPENIEDCLRLYGLDHSTVMTFNGNPIDYVPELIKAGIPIALVAGDSDEVVPHRENAQLLADLYKKSEGTLLYILKLGCGHHPHSVEDPTPVTDFLINAQRI